MIRLHDWSGHRAWGELQALQCFFNLSKGLLAIVSLNFSSVRDSWFQSCRLSCSWCRLTIGSRLEKKQHARVWATLPSLLDNVKFVYERYSYSAFIIIPKVCQMVRLDDWFNFKLPYRNMFPCHRIHSQCLFLVHTFPWRKAWPYSSPRTHMWHCKMTMEANPTKLHETFETTSTFLLITLNNIFLYQLWSLSRQDPGNWQYGLGSTRWDHPMPVGSLQGLLGSQVPFSWRNSTWSRLQRQNGFQIGI